MINEHINLFILSNPGQSEDGLLHFRKLIEILLTELGSDLYTYLLFLKNTERISEAELIASYRNLIFDSRTAYAKGTIKESEISHKLKVLLEKISVQVIMLQSGPKLHHWEIEILKNFTNDVRCFISYLDKLELFGIKELMNDE